MGKKIGYVLIGVFATLGVLFLILLFMPDDEEEDTADQAAVTSSQQDDEDEEPVTKPDTGKKEDTEKEEESRKDEEADAGKEDGAQQASDDPGAYAEVITVGSGNSANVSIPNNEISNRTLKFQTASLENKKVTEKVFSDYDLTIVHMWGTYCQPCIGEMGDYAELYKELPANVNLIAIVCDVYDGIDNNVSDANRILGDAGAEFTNLRLSDDLYEITEDLQYVPSSFFVDREGHLIGEMMDGAGFDETKERLEGYLK